MFKTKKIQRFIKKYEEYFYAHNHLELAEFLSGIKDIETIISKINKLSEDDANYVLSTIVGYQEFDFSKYIVNLILIHKLDLVKKFGTYSECPNLDNIYYALQSNESLYKLFVQEYKDYHITTHEYKYLNGQNSNITLANYSYVFSNWNQQFHDILEKNRSAFTLKDQLLSYSKEKLMRFLDFSNAYSTTKNKKKVFNTLVQFNSDTSDEIKLLSMDDFQSLLQFLFSFNEELDQDQVLEAKLKLIPEILEIQSSEESNLNMKLLLHNLNGLPEYYMIQLADDISSHTQELERLDLLDFLAQKEGCELVEYISETAPDYDEEIYKLITSREFHIFSNKEKLLIMKYLPSRNQLNLEVYQEQVKFLMDFGSYRFAPTLLGLDSTYLEKTIEFIRDEDNIEVLNAKFEALNCIKVELDNGSVSLDLYQKYLEILGKNLGDKTNREKKKYLKARSKYFEEHSFIDFIDSFKFNESNEELTKLLETENSVERMEQYYHFAKFIDWYNPEIIDMSIERLSSIQSNKNLGMFVEFITDAYFTNSDLNRQKTLLNLFPVESTTQEFGPELEIVIPDSSCFKDIILDSDKPLKFKNNETGMKIFVKKSNKNIEKKQNY